MLRRVAPPSKVRSRNLDQPQDDNQGLNLLRKQVSINPSDKAKHNSVKSAIRIRRPVAVTEYSQRQLQRHCQSLKTIEKHETLHLPDGGSQQMADLQRNQEDSKKVTPIEANFKTKLNLQKDNAKYFCFDYSEHLFPIRFDFGCESGCFFLYLSFVHDHPNRLKKDLATRNSKFEILHPPNQKKETEELMQKIVKLAAKQAKKDGEDKEMKKLGKFIYFAVYPLKNLEVSLLIKCESILSRKPLDQETSEMVVEKEDFTEIRLQTSRRQLQTSSKQGEIVERNKVLAHFAPQFTAINQRLFTLIQEKRSKVATSRKLEYTQTGFFRPPDQKYSLTGPKQIVKPEVRAAYRVNKRLSDFEHVSQLLDRQVGLRVKAIWIVIICVRRVFMDIRNRRLKKSEKAEGYFDQLLKRLRFRKLAQQFHDKIIAEIDKKAEKNEPTSTMQLVGISLRFQQGLAFQRLQFKTKKTLAGLLSQICLKTKLSMCIDGMIFNTKWKKFRDYKEERLRYYKLRWMSIQGVIVRHSKEQGTRYHEILEKDLKTCDERFQAFQDEVLRLVYRREYLRYLETVNAQRKKIDASTPYSLDIPKLKRWLDNQDYGHLIKKAEDMMITLSGFEKLFEKGISKNRKWGNLKMFAENDIDEANLDSLDKRGKLNALLKFSSKWQAIYTRGKFFFSLEPSFLINLIICCYHLDNDRELVDELAKKDQSAAPTRRNSGAAVIKQK